MLQAAMDPPPAEHAGQADAAHEVIFNQDLFHQVLLALERIEGFHNPGKSKLRLLCRATRQMVDSHVKGMNTFVDSEHGTPDQLVQTMLRLNAGCPALTTLTVNGASHIDLLGALLANLSPSLASLKIVVDMVRRRDACVPPGLICTCMSRAPGADELSERIHRSPAGLPVDPASPPASRGNQPDRAGNLQQACDQHRAGRRVHQPTQIHRRRVLAAD
jgi:hypothetical protein